MIRFCSVSCKTCATILLFLSMPFGFRLVTQGFRAQKVLFSLPFSLSNDPITIDLSGPFFYLGKGLQCYVFEDRAGDHVLKLFRSDLRKQKSSDDLLKRLYQTFTSYTLAYEKLREETGLIAIHLEETKELPAAIFYDAIGVPHSLPLDRLHFVVQKKAILFKQALIQGTKEERSRRIDSLLQLWERRIASGICKTDQSIGKNIGFIGDQAIEIDCGDYIDCQNCQNWEEKERISMRTALYNWLAHHHLQPVWSSL